MATNYITKVAVVGATGNVGKFVTSSLLATGKHSVTALTRAGTGHTFPEGVVAKEVDYEQPSTIVDALRGQHALVITLSARAFHAAAEEVLVRAAAEAGVPWVLPNEWSPDTADEGLLRDVMFFPKKKATRELIEKLGRSSYISVSTGFWYEWSLAIPKAYGFEFADRKVQFYDDGETKVSTSTWPHVGRAVAALLSLPIERDASATTNDKPTLSGYRNKVVYTSSFTLSQLEMLASALRVTGTKESEWTITSDTSRNMYDVGLESFKLGDWTGPGNFLYGRVFFPKANGGGGDFSPKGTINAALGLPDEDLDEATGRAIERQASGKIY